MPPIIPPSRRGPDLILRVEGVTTGSGRARFVSLPRQLYRGDHRWIPLIGSARRDALRVERNPLLRGGNLGAFLGIAQNLGLGDETIGMLAACSTPGEPEDEAGAWGSWGLFEAMNVEELADRLFYEVENWLFENTPGITGLRGPWSIEPLVAPGLLTDGFDAQPVAFLPYNPPYYPEMVEAQGYAPGPTWRAYSLELSAAADQSRTPAAVSRETWARIAAAFSTDDGAADGGALVPGLTGWLHHLSGARSFAFNRSWRDAVERAFRCAIAEVREDEGAGVAACFGIPDIGDALRVSRGRSFPLGWLLYEIWLRRPARLRVFPAGAGEAWDTSQVADLYASVAERAREAGYRTMDIAPVSDADERTVQALRTIGARPKQQFTVYEKAL